MGSVIICGGGVIGLSAALMLGRDGHQVTVLEADPDGAPATAGQAWAAWPRRGVAQFRQPHNLFPRFRQVCDEELPDLPGRLLAAGCPVVDYLGAPGRGQPPTLPDPGPCPGDEMFRSVAGRRPVVESVLAAAAEDQPGVTIRRGVRATELTRGRSAVPGVPHVTGVRTSDDREQEADLVIDAMGRRSPGVALLGALGARPPVVESEDSGFTYYTRFFTGPSRPHLIGPALMPLGTISVLTIEGDNDTWSVTVCSASADTRVKALRDPEVFTRLIRACPLQARWLDGQPITGILPMAGILDRYRRFTVGGVPVATGFAAVGDAWACTNPSAGRGISVGLVHAQLLRRTVRDHLGDPVGFARAWDEGTELTVAPFFRNQIRADRARLAEMTALREGRQPPPPDPASRRLLTAAMQDATVFRAFLETVLCLALPQEVLSRPAVAAAVGRLGDGEPRPFPGPDRPRLLELVS
jgi:2-polyprenyl-6-methoxyphenol hydroxylase-like FAD-dependent oxidoreductase